MVDYLYYKLYQAALKSSLDDIPEYVAPIFLGGLISVNILVGSAFLANLEVLPFLYADTKGVSIVTIILILCAFLYYRKNRYELIIQKYSLESNIARKRGNIIVGIYVGLSYLLLFVVGYFKP